jgi:acyl-CoA reductase-like NAD-dependent aldehyde dehydrogenase
MTLPDASAAVFDPTDLQGAFAHARSAFAFDSNPDAASRRASLGKLGRLLKEHMGAIEAAINADFGSRSPHETRLLEIFPALSAIGDARRHVSRWMRPRRSWASLWFLPARNEIRPQPLGVVGIIVPWNYPILLAVAPLAGALAAGNRVMIKMSEFTPRTGELFATLIRQAFPADQVQVFNGDANLARAFSALPFDHLLFTGSTAVGRQVMHAAADNLTPVTLELGGKSPAIVGPECDIDEAAHKILFGKCLNAGQTCIAPDYVLLPRDQEVAFARAAARAVGESYPSLADNPDYSAIINARHIERLQRYLDDARERGALITALGDDAKTAFARGKIVPTLLRQVTDEMRVMQEEIFGPLLPLVPYDDLDDAIRYVNARPRPLALYYFGHNRTHIDRVLDETVSGGVSVNETILHISQETLPFGGVGASGMGAYHGYTGFQTFSKMKPVFHQARLNGLGLFKPPFGKRFDALIKLLLR